MILKSIYSTNHQNISLSQNLYHCINKDILINLGDDIENNEDCYTNEHKMILKNLNSFFCSSNLKFISILLVCNFINDCPEGEDEIFCSKRIT